MTDPTITITISKSGGDIVLSGTVGEGDHGVTRYSPPGKQRRVGYMPTNGSINGDEKVSSSLQQGMLSFDWCPDTSTDESDVAAAFEDVDEALDQFEYTVTTEISDADAEVWSADPGSIVLRDGERTFTSLVNKNPVYTVQIPVYPIAGSS